MEDQTRIEWILGWEDGKGKKNDWEGLSGKEEEEEWKRVRRGRGGRRGERKEGIEGRGEEERRGRTEEEYSIRYNSICIIIYKNIIYNV